MSMVVYDSFERMSGYTYFGIIDFDEFLIPSKDRSLKKMLVSSCTYDQTAKESDVHHENMPI